MYRLKDGQVWAFSPNEPGGAQWIRLVRSPKTERNHVSDAQFLRVPGDIHELIVGESLS